MYALRHASSESAFPSVFYVHGFMFSALDAAPVLVVFFILFLFYNSNLVSLDFPFLLLFKFASLILSFLSSNGLTTVCTSRYGVHNMGYYDAHSTRLQTEANLPAFTCMSSGTRSTYGNTERRARSTKHSSVQF